jgi:hypothetical protein
MESSSWNSPSAIFVPDFYGKNWMMLSGLLFMPVLIHYFFWIKHPEDIKVYLVWGFGTFVLIFGTSSQFS